MQEVTAALLTRCANPTELEAMVDTWCDLVVQKGFERQQGQVARIIRKSGLPCCGSVLFIYACTHLRWTTQMEGHTLASSTCQETFQIEKS